MPELYCGNNANFPGLLNGTHVAGTRHQCFQRGVGVGRNLPYDSTYASGPYAPLQAPQVYCGAGPVPAGHILGTSAMCLQKGVGVGKLQRAQLGRDWIKISMNLFVLSIISGVLFLILYKAKPVFVLKDDAENASKPREERDIDWVRFVPWYIVFVSVLFFIKWKVTGSFVN